MGTSASKDKPPATRQSFAHATALPPPYQLAIEDTAFTTMVLEGDVSHDHDCDRALIPATWFSVTPTESTTKRYLYLVQNETETGLIVLLLMFDRSAVSEDAGIRLPPSGAWMRAVVDGTVHVLASDLALTRKAITAWIGGREPPTSPARPPYT